MVYHTLGEKLQFYKYFQLPSNLIDFIENQFYWSERCEWKMIYHAFQNSREIWSHISK